MPSRPTVRSALVSVVALAVAYPATAAGAGAEGTPTDTGRSARPHQVRLSLGIASLALGIGGVGTAVTGGVLMAQHRDTYETEPNERGNAAVDYGQARGLLIGGLVAAGLLIPAGVALVVIGERRRREFTFAPSLGPTTAGARFEIHY